MEGFKVFFLCDNCTNKNFKRIFNFSLLFHGVNFSNDLIYDELIEETYQCTKCQKVYTKKQIDDGLNNLKKKHNKPLGVRQA